MTILYPLKFVLAFCSIVYELLLAQGLSAFMEDTVLRYCITIGLYMCSLGAGAWLSEGRLVRNPVVTLSAVEIALTVIGGSSVAAMYALDFMHVSRAVFAVGIHALIVVIGVLTGMEVPLVLALRNKEKGGDENRILAADYAGALSGTLLFAFVFYSRLGLAAAAFCTGLLNAVAGVSLFTQRDKLSGRRAAPAFMAMIAVQAVLCAVIAYCLFNVESVAAFFTGRYVSG